MRSDDESLKLSFPSFASSPKAPNLACEQCKPRTLVFAFLAPWKAEKGRPAPAALAGSTPSSCRVFLAGVMLFGFIGAKCYRLSGFTDVCRGIEFRLQILSWRCCAGSWQIRRRWLCSSRAALPGEKAWFISMDTGEAPFVGDPVSSSIVYIHYNSSLCIHMCTFT